jgi:hypothetical protein
MQSRHGHLPLCGLAAFAMLILTVTSAKAALIVADFNDVTAGAINGKAGGTGLSGSWSGSAQGIVVAGNLTSSLYSLTQAGTAQHLQNTTQGLRQNYRTIPTSPTGEVWFSFLAQADAAGNRAGISLNVPTTATPFDNTGNIYAYLNGSSLSYSFGAGTAGTVAAANTVGSTALVVGRMNIVGGSGMDSIDLWVNPDLISNPSIFAYTPAYTSSSVNFLDSLTLLGVIVSRPDSGGSGAGHVDNVRFSDGGGNAAQAYLDVTGALIPEPSAVALAALGIVGCLFSRRRIFCMAAKC